LEGELGMDNADLKKYRKILEEFLEDYSQFVDSRRTYIRRDTKTKLQRNINLVSDIVNNVHGGFSFKLVFSTPKSFHQALVISLSNTLSYEDYSQIDPIIICTLNEAIGNIVNGTIPAKEIAPILPILDEDLRKRCMDLLNAPGSFDRVIREATVVLEDRLRGKIPHEKLSEIIPNSVEQIGDALAGKLLSPSNPVIVVSKEKREREAFLKMVQGIFAYFRNSSHHALDDKTRWSLAWSVVGLVDSILIELNDSYVSTDSLADSTEKDIK
jgi:hypothetical protein